MTEVSLGGSQLAEGLEVAARLDQQVQKMDREWEDDQSLGQL